LTPIDLLVFEVMSAFDEDVENMIGIPNMGAKKVEAIETWMF
jgi:hypothetical protein